MLTAPAAPAPLLRLPRLQGEEAAPRAFLELGVPAARVFVQQPIELTLRIGLEQSFWRDQLVPMFSQPLDLPVQVLAPWLDDLAGTVLLPAPAVPAGERVQLALGDRLAAARRGADQQRFGRTYAVFELERRYLPTRAGALEVPAPRLRLHYATTFRDDFVLGRVPLDQQSAVIPGSPLALQVEALPPHGRPRGFTNAVGRFTIRAGAAPTALAVGEPCTLTLRIEGNGNLATFVPPPLDALRGLHLQSRTDRTDGAVRTIQAELVPEAATVHEVPAIELPFFDPREPAGYHVAATAPIALSVRPRAAPAAPAPESERERRFPAAALPWTLLLAVLALLAITAPWVRRRAERRRAPELALAAAVETLRAAMAGDGDVAAAFAALLAARLGCAPAAVISPDLPLRLRDAGIPPTLANRAAEVLETLHGSRYGGVLPAVSKATLTELAAAIATLPADA